MAEEIWREIITFEEAWPKLQEGINKMIGHFQSEEDDPNRPVFTSSDYMEIYTYPPPRAQILPSLRGKEDENLLRELLRRWNNHKAMVRLLSRLFYPLDRQLVVHKQLPSVVEVGYLAYYNLVYGEFHDQIRDAIVSLIDREREGCQIDSTLVKEVVDIYKLLSEEVGKGKVEQNVKDLEDAVIKSAATFYLRNASSWIANMSLQDYMLKIDECLEQEKARASYYSKFRSEDKLLKVLKCTLLTVCTVKLQEEMKAP